MAENSGKGIPDELLASYRELLKKLEDINSEFPETKKFLASRGLRHVGELDVQGQKDLAAHLTAVRDALIEEK